MMKYKTKLEGFNILIGAVKDVTPEFVKSNNIKAIVSVCEKDSPAIGGVAQFKVKMSDPLTGLAPNNPMDEAVEIFNMAKNIADRKEGNIFIHCVHGHNRSRLTVALWLVKYKGMDLTSAVKFTQVKDNKPWMKDLGFIW